MQRAAIRSLSLLLFALPAFARAAPPLPPYAMEQWSQPGDCDTQHRRHAADPTSASGVPARVLMQRYLGVLDEVVAGDPAALKFAHLCARLGVDFHPGALPPPRPEPWNPSPPQPVGSVFTAYVDAPGGAFQQSLEATYLADSASLSLSFSSNGDTPAFPPDVPAYRYRGMGDACPLRLGQLTGKLAAAGFSKEYGSLEPPKPDYADSDYGVSASFQRDGLAVAATLQGPFVEQRADPEAACVARITLTLAK